MGIDYSNPKNITRTVLLAVVVLAILLSLLTGCSVTSDVPKKDHKKCCAKK